jgi:hypothetical protein
MIPMDAPPVPWRPAQALLYHASATVPRTNPSDFFNTHGRLHQLSAFRVFLEPFFMSHDLLLDRDSKGFPIKRFSSIIH